MKLLQRFLLLLTLIIFLAFYGCAPPTSSDSGGGSSGGTTDGTPPYVSSSNVSNGATNVDISTDIIVHVLDAGVGVKLSSIVMTVEGVTVTPGISGTRADFTVTYSPSIGFSSGQVVDVTIDAKDRNGNTMNTVSWSFTVTDSTKPYVSNQNVSNGATKVDINTDIIVHVLDAGVGVRLSSIVMTVEGVTVTPGISGTRADYTVTYSPSVSFSSGQVVDVTLDAKDRNGNTMNTVSWSFTVKYVNIRGTLIVPYTVIPRLGRTMYAILMGDVLPGATVDLLDSDEVLLDSTISDAFGDYVFNDVDPGENYIVHAYIGNINLYDIVPYVESDVDVGQTDATSTALYLLATYYVANDTTVSSFADIDVGALMMHLEADDTLVDEVVLTLETFGDTAAASGDVIADWVALNEDTVLAAQAVIAGDPAVSITASSDSVAVGDEFYIYVNAAFMSNLYGAAIKLEFDSTLIQVKDSNATLAGTQLTYSQGDFLSSAEATLLVDYDNDFYDTLIVGISKLDQQAGGNDGSGNLLRITFEALAVTSSTVIRFNTASVLADPNGDEIVTTSWNTASKAISIQ